MITIVEIIAGLLFVASSGIFFNERFRRNKFLIVSAGCIGLVSTYFLTVEIIERVIDQRIAGAIQSAPPQEPTTSNDEQHQENQLNLANSPTPQLASAPASPASEQGGDSVTDNELTDVGTAASVPQPTRSDIASNVVAHAPETVAFDGRPSREFQTDPSRLVGRWRVFGQNCSTSYPELSIETASSTRVEARQSMAGSFSRMISGTYDYDVIEVHEDRITYRRPDLYDRSRSLQTLTWIYSSNRILIVTNPEGRNSVVCTYVRT